MRHDASRKGPAVSVLQLFFFGNQNHISKCHFAGRGHREKKYTGETQQVENQVLVVDTFLQ